MTKPDDNHIHEQSVYSNSNIHTPIIAQAADTHGLNRSPKRARRQGINSTDLEQQLQSHEDSHQ